MMSGGVRNEAAQRSRPRISIRDVAKRANVSIATVSRALNSGQEIHPETRDHIRQVARELGYVVSARGRGLVNGRTDSVGVIIGREYLPVFLDPFYGEVLGGIELELEARNLSLVLTSQERDDSLLDFAAGQRVDGLLVIGRDLPENTLVDMQGYLPVVLVDRRAEGLNTVNSEHRSACADITRYLISRGCTRLAFLAEDLGNPNFQERFLGFQDALQEAGRSCPAGFSTLPLGKAAATRLSSKCWPQARECRTGWSGPTIRWRWKPFVPCWMPV